MKNSYLKAFLSLMVLCSFQMAIGQTQLESEKITSRYDKTKLNQLQSQLQQKANANKQNAIQSAQLRSIPLTIEEDGKFSELQRIAEDGSPIYYTTFNVDAARSTRTNHLNIGGSLGLNLDGQNMIGYVWDGGHARVSHQEYDGPGGTNRVTIEDASTEGGTQLNFHAAHVTGTVMASGVQADAKGMAPQARVRGYMWNNDASEATSAAANGMLLSNHSYGFRSDLVPDQYFGAYIEESRTWDEIMFNAPNYLMVVAAGNDGNTNYNGNPLGGNSQYDKLTGHSTSKNNLVVANAQDANVDANGNLISVSINSSSSEGPTDDLRIKPDITGNGTAVYSTYQNSDTAYNSITGTSMASPNVMGSLLLLQQHNNNLKGSFMRASTLKGLALHTADDAGSNGPDAIFGWGLLNAKRAAETLSQDGNESKIEELTLSSGQSYSITVDSDGVSPLLASISWTDRAGTATTATNSGTAVLVNDLDIRVTQGGTTYSPWRLTGITTNGTGDNSKDPYERVDVNAASGTYTITVTHKGSLVGGSQNFSLIVTGLSSTPVVCNATTPSGLNIDGFGSSTATVSWDAVPGASYDLRYRATGTSSWTTNAVSGTSASISGLSPQTQYEVQVRSKCPDNSTSGYSSSATFTTTEVQLNYCASASTNINDEYIGRVQLGTIDNASGGQFYTDFTSISTDLTKGDSYSITVTPTWTGTIYSEGYSVWIDYNKDGDFNDAGEQLWTQAATTATPVSGSFTVPTSAVDGATRMRVSMKYNGIPTSCESFTYGEVEDYTVNLGAGSGPDTQAPTAPTNLSASNVTETTVDLSWTASSDNVGVTGYDVYQGSTNLGTVTGTSANITGLTASTTYTFSVRAKDAAGNVSGASNTVSVTTDSGADTQAPTAPTGLAASSVAETTLTLTWNASSDNVGVTGYDVYQGSTNLGEVGGTSANITGLTAGTTYTFSVRAKDAAGNVSAASNTVTVTTQSGSGPVTDILNQGFFETGWDGWSDGGSDCYRDNDYRSYEGNYSIRLRDNSGTASAMTSPVFNLTPYDTVEVEFYFYPHSMENGEDFWLRYYNGSSWTTVASWARGSSFNNGSFYTATVTLDAATYNFASNSRFRFQCDASANGDQIYMDAITITGKSGTTNAYSTNNTVQIVDAYSTLGEDVGQAFEGDLSVYPNPASTFASIRLGLDIEDEAIDVNVAVMDIQGRVVLHKSFSAISNEIFEDRLNVSGLNQGIYMVNITSSNGMKETHKLIIN